MKFLTNFLSIGYILPVIVSSTIYPMLLNAYKEGMDKMQNLYKKAFIPFSLYGLVILHFYLFFCRPGDTDVVYR
ncbi:MAG: hypothetical protein V9E88_14115 [Ferruginibacter sp.]